MKSIPLFNRAQSGLVTVVDDEDFLRFQHYRWRLSSSGYAIRSYVREGHEVLVSLHREIMQAPKGLVVDHINHDTLLNTRENLRVVTQQINLMNRRLFSNNSSSMKGVIRQHDQWLARIQKGGIHFHLGFFADLTSAGLAYDSAAMLLFGEEYVWRNFPDLPIPSWIEALVRQHLATAG
jgi:hypothetical protein